MKDNKTNLNKHINSLGKSNTPVPKNLQRLSRLMDNSIVLPGGYRIGWDAIIGLLPGVGDIAGLAISLYIVAGAHRAGASISTLFRMLFNVGVETVLGVVPVFGDLFDMAFKANVRNMRLLENQYSDPATVATQSNRRMWLLIVGSLLLIGFTLYGVIRLLSTLLGWIL